MSVCTRKSPVISHTDSEFSKHAHVENSGRCGRIFKFLLPKSLKRDGRSRFGSCIHKRTSHFLPAVVCFQFAVFPVYLKLSKKKKILSIIEVRSKFLKSPQIIPFLTSTTAFLPTLGTTSLDQSGIWS